jgi:hypothetical protein
MPYGTLCPKCGHPETDYNNSDPEQCGGCRNRAFRASHGGVDRVTDFLFPGLKNLYPTD